MKTREEESHPWEARFMVGLLMLLLGFVGLVVTNIERAGAWNYWRALCVINAVLCIWLNWYIRKQKKAINIPFLWRELMHWFGLLLAVYLVSVFVSIGIMSPFIASLAVLTLLALTTFLCGVYSEPALMVVGLVLGIFCAGSAYVEENLYTIMLPITACAALILFIVIRNKEKKIDFSGMND